MASLGSRCSYSVLTTSLGLALALGGATLGCSSSGGGGGGSGGMTGTAGHGEGGSAQGGSGEGGHGAGGSAEGGSGEGGSTQGGTGGSATGGTGGSATGGAGGTAMGGAGGTPMGGAGGTQTGGAGGTQTPTAAFVYVSGFAIGDDAVRAFELDLSSGSLTARGSGEMFGAPGYGAIRPDGRHIYFLQEVYNGQRYDIEWFAINPANGMLTKNPTGRANTATQNVHLSVHPSGNWLFLASFGTDTVKSFPIMANGNVGPEAASVQPGGDANPHQVITDPAGRFVFAPCMNVDKVAVYEFNNTTGALTARPQIDLTDGPRHMAFHPSERWAYVLTELDADVVSFEYNKDTGALTAPMRHETRAGENWAAHIVASPNGKFVFASARRQPRLFAYTVNEQTGRLTLVQTFQDSDLGTPRDFGIDPTGKYLVVASQNLNRVFVAEINQTSGMLTKVANSARMVANEPAFVGITAKR